MDLEIVILSEVCQQRKTNIIYRLYMESKKMVQMNLFTKQKLVTDVENNGYQGGKVGGCINWEIGIDIHTLLYIKDN